MNEPAPSRQYEQVMPIAAIPVIVGTAITQTPDGQAVLVTIHSPMGVTAFVLPPDIITNQLIPQLRTAAMQARTGLTLPGL